MEYVYLTANILNFRYCRNIMGIDFLFELFTSQKSRYGLIIDTLEQVCFSNHWEPVAFSSYIFYSNRKRLTIALDRREKLSKWWRAENPPLKLPYNLESATVRNIKKKWAELDRYEITFGFPARLNGSRLRRPSTDNVDQAIK